ncbi:MAG: prepilin-type N-terminal cleavage/methylation domain-containing protein, partial [Shewanella sp.]
MKKQQGFTLIELVVV